MGCKLSRTDSADDLAEAKANAATAPNGAGSLATAANGASLGQEETSSQAPAPPNSEADEVILEEADTAPLGAPPPLRGSDRLHKNFQDRLLTAQISKNGQRMTDSQMEFFKMLDDKIDRGPDYESRDEERL